MKSAIVILNWNGKKLLEKFLPSLILNTGKDADIFVADNASTDESVNWLKQNYPEINIIVNDSNEGFAGGYNKALSQIKADYFLLLNSDVEVTQGWLEPLTNYLDNVPEAAACQPKILWERQRDTFEYSGASGGYLDYLGYPFCRGRLFANLEKDNGQYNKVANIFWASGACMLVRSDVFRKLGGFDESFFAHMEEIDLCWRIQKAGHTIACIPSSVVYHVGGATLPKNNPGKTFLNFRNNLSMLYKNLPARKMVPIIFIRLLLDGVAGIKFLSEGNWRDCIAVIKAHFAFYGRVAGRKLIRTVAGDNDQSEKLIYSKSIVLQYYIAGKKHFSELGIKL